MSKASNRHPIAKSLVVLAAMCCAASSAAALNDNPTPYDSEGFNPSTLAPRSTSSYFFMDARLPRALMGAFDQQKLLGITGFFIGGNVDKSEKGQGAISASDIAIMQPPDRVCSAYSSDVCYNVGRFYVARLPQVGMTGLLALDSSTMLQWGLNTGYNSAKLTVSPSVLVGVAKRFYLNDRRDSHVIIEASEWLGGSVKHRPCVDDFNRQYYCADISAWSDFTYDARPQSAFVKVTYEALF